VSLFVAALALIVFGVVAAFVLRRHPAGDRVYTALVGAGCASGFVQAVRVLATGNSASLTIHAWVPGGDWVVGVDALSAIFLIAIFAVGAASVAFGAPYMDAERDHRPVWFVHAAVGVLIAAMALVVTAQSIVVFLVRGS
jgi:hydrogenase-4 component B